MIIKYPKRQTIVVQPINSIRHACCIVCSTNRKKLKYRLNRQVKSAFSKRVKE